jgi:hypothetical protein
MGLQLIVQADSAVRITRLLGDVASQTEVFNLSGELWGICIPTKLVDRIGESAVRERLDSLSVFDLYEGRWRYA